MDKKSLAYISGWLAGIVTIVLILLFVPFLDLGTISTDVLIPVTFWSGLVFIAYYSCLARWWRNPMGRMIVGLDFALVLITLDNVLMQMGVHLSPLSEIRVIALSLMIAVLVIVSRVFLLGWIHNWKPTWPWRLKRKIQEEQGDRKRAG